MRRLDMHVTRFSAATILVFAIASPLHAQGIEVFGGYSANADYVQNRPAILVADQKVSPFFSHGSGPIGFEASFKHDVRNGLGIKADPRDVRRYAERVCPSTDQQIVFPGRHVNWIDQVLGFLRCGRLVASAIATPAAPPRYSDRRA
jgi:hypothetical protein